MWVPEWLYKKLPLVYLAVGLVLLMLFGFNGPTTISTLLLFGSALLTALWRREHQVEAEATRFREEWAERRDRRVRHSRRMDL